MCYLSVGILLNQVFSNRVIESGSYLRISVISQEFRMSTSEVVEICVTLYCSLIYLKKLPDCGRRIRIKTDSSPKMLPRIIFTRFVSAFILLARTFLTLNLSFLSSFATVILSCIREPSFKTNFLRSCPGFSAASDSYFPKSYWKLPSRMMPHVSD